MHAHLLRRQSAIQTLRRRNIEIIPSHRTTNMVILHQPLVGRVETHPAEARNQRLHPGVRGLRRQRPLFRNIARRHIPGHIPARDPQHPHQRDHDVRKVLAYALARPQRIINRGIHTRRTRLVNEVLEDAHLDLPQHRHRIITAHHMQLRRQFHQQRTRLRIVAWHQHFPIVVARHRLVDLVPHVRTYLLRPGRERLHFDQRRCGDSQILVPRRNIEVMHDVAEVVVILKHARPRRHIEMERQAVLGPLRAGMQSHFHRCLADGVRIPELRLVLDRVVHLRTQSLFDRIVDVGVLNRQVDLIALILNLFELAMDAAGQHLIDLDVP